MGHYADCLIIRCGDDRYCGYLELARGLERILVAENAGTHFAPGGGFGSSLEFRSPDAKRLWNERLRLAKGLDIKRVILIDHLDCAAFHEAFGQMTPVEERQKHLEMIEEARRFFQEYAPWIQFVAYLQDRDEIVRTA